MRLYDLSGNLIHQLEGASASFSPDGQYLVTFPYDYVSDEPMRLYDLSGNLIHRLEGRYASFSPDNQYLVTPRSSNDESLLYDLSGNLIQQLEGTSASFSPDSQYLVTYSYSSDEPVRLYDRSGTLIQQLEGRSASFSPDGDWLLISLEEGISQIYDTHTGSLLAEFPGSDPVLSNDESLLLTKLDDISYRLWRVDNGLDDLLAWGCNWLESYFTNYPEERLEVCKAGAGN
ncbi:MAG: hypothetical protein QNJ46_07180 [Leptolyngbyaceae cyanobacterium MO_188.B28]|nr:hypothetical protein [Leptolyngbyaceae cyanobacterium MO_188.B28]